MTDGRTFDIRPIWLLLVVPIVALVESVGFYTHRTYLLQYWTTELGLTTEAGFTAFAWLPLWGVAGLVLSVIVAAIAGGWGATLTGLTLLALGISLRGVVPDEWYLTPAGLMQVGHSATTLGLTVVVLDGLRGRWLWLAVAGLGGTWAATVLGGRLGPAFQSAYWLFGDAWSKPLIASILALAWLVGLAAAAVSWTLQRRGPPADPRRSQIKAVPILASLGLLGLGLGLVAVGWYAAYLTFDVEQLYAEVTGSPPPLRPAAFLLTAMALAVLLAICGIAATLIRLRPRPLLLGGLAGLLLAAAVLLPHLAAGAEPPLRLQAVVASLVLSIAADGLVLTAVVAGTFRDLHWRLLPVGVGLWRFGALLVWWGAGSLDPDILSDPVPASVWTAAVVSGLLGLGFLGIAAGASRIWPRPPEHDRGEGEEGQAHRA